LLRWRKGTVCACCEMAEAEDASGASPEDMAGAAKSNDDEEEAGSTLAADINAK